MNVVATEAIKVYQVQPARPAVAGWLHKLLMPVIAACRLRGAYPIEFRPTGRWGGWADSPDVAPDRRVAVSNLALHRTKRGLVTTFLHEVAHQLVSDEHGHDAAFFAVNLILLLRVEATVDSREEPSSGAGARPRTTLQQRGLEANHFAS